jgi:hypothetical protein
MCRKITYFDKNKSKTTKQQTNKQTNKKKTKKQKKQQQKQSKAQKNTKDICTNVSSVVHPYTINTIVLCQRSTSDMCSILKS